MAQKHALDAGECGDQSAIDVVYIFLPPGGWYQCQATGYYFILIHYEVFLANREFFPLDINVYHKNAIMYRNGVN